MGDSNSLSERWQEFRPSKGLWFWSCIASIVLTMIVGFTVGGWTTGGTANSMAAEARQEAKEQLIASICIDRFAAAPQAPQNLKELKAVSSWDQDQFIEDGGWATIKALEEQIPGAAELCADKLVAMEQLPPRAATPAATAGTTTADG